MGLSLLDLLVLAAGIHLGATPPPSAYAPPPDPGPSAACPEDMRLVTGRHFDEVEHVCIDWKKGPNRCYGYYPEMTVAHGAPEPIRVCMDQYEAPNRKGAKAIVMKSLPQAIAWCKDHGKRLCTESEWETACESGDERPWQYGWSVDQRACNSDRGWKEFDAKALMAGGETAQREVDRLWQGLPSGELSSCRTRDGIYDLMGNVEEWVTSSRKRKFPGALMGGFWAKPWTGCRGVNDAHEPSFVFYEVGFRCCVDPRADPRGDASPAEPASSSAPPAPPAP